MNRNIKYKLQNFFCKDPLIFRYTYGLRPDYIRLAVNKKTQLVIEGYPRSANTFAVVAMNESNPGVEIAHHLHVPAQIIQAVQWNIPTLVLIRDPKNAVASMVLRQPEMSVLQGLKNYIFFYESIQSYNSGYIVAMFEDVIRDYSQIINSLNMRFSTKFKLFAHTNTSQDKVFDKIETFDSNFLKTSRPNDNRTKLKIEIIESIENEYLHLLVRAKEIYSIFTALK
jgi:hypothetical protein